MISVVRVSMFKINVKPEGLGLDMRDRVKYLNGWG